MSDKEYDEIENPVPRSEMNLFDPFFVGMITESYVQMNVYDTIDEMILYILQMYNKCSEDIVNNTVPNPLTKHEYNMYSLVGDFISRGYPKKIYVNQGSLKETNSTSNLDDFSESLEIGVMSRIDMLEDDMKKYGLPENTFVKRNREPEHYGKEVHFRMARLPIVFQLKLPNMSVHSRSLNFLNRLFYEFIHVALQRLYYTNYGMLIRHVLQPKGGKTAASVVHGAYVISSVLELPVTDITVIGTDARIKQVDISSVVSILGQNKTKMYPILTINTK